MEVAGYWRFVSFALLTVVTAVRGQMCEAESFPPQYVPADDTSTLQSNAGTFYVYPNVFTTTQCVGTVVTPQYSFCYLRATSGPPREVFTVLLLRNGADSYTVLDSYTETEDRSCAQPCCKTVDRAVEVSVQSDLALGFVIPSDPGGNFLYAAVNDISQGFQINTAGLQLSTSVGGTISKASLGLSTAPINNRRFSVAFQPLAPITMGSDMTTTEENMSTTDNGGDTGMTTSQGSGTAETGSTSTTNNTVAMTTTIAMTTTQENGPVASSSNAGAVAAGVIVALLVVGVATAIVVVLVVLLLRREKQKKGNVQVTSPTHLGALDNHTYETQVEIGTINGNPASYFINHSLNDYAHVADSKNDESSCYEEMNGGGHYELPTSASMSMKMNSGSTQQFRHKPSTQRSRGDTHPLPPVPGVDPYGDHFGSFSSQGMGRSTLNAKTLVSKGRTGTIPDEEPIYQDPAESEAALYEQYQRLNVTYIQKEQVSTTDVLGSGQFGVVYRGEWSKPGEEKAITVAVKTLKGNTDEEQRVKFLQEAAIIGQFSHPNVVKLHGIVPGEKKMIVLELLQGGDLRQALLNLNRSREGAKVDADLPHTLLSYCRQVAAGMAYLSQKGFVHRDLAARNILLSEDCECKITDFGMSRDLANTNYYVSHGGKVPVKWTAPEAIHFHTYSTASDVWSFGCVMYETWSLGNKPFGSYSNSDCIRLIGEGSRLPPPPGCPKTIYTLMIDCWHPESSSRPGFVSIVQQLSLPDTKILKWSEEDKTAHPEASVLGAGLDKSVDLYKDLQDRYINMQNTD